MAQGADKTIKINREFFSFSSGSKKGGRRQTRKVARPTLVAETNDTKAKELKKRLLSSISASRKAGTARNAIKTPDTALGTAMSFFERASSERKRGFRQQQRQKSVITKPVQTQPPPVIDARVPPPVIDAREPPPVIDAREPPPVIAIETDQTSQVRSDNRMTTSNQKPRRTNPPDISRQIVPPPYGCLKGGDKPTYRQWRRSVGEHSGQKKQVVAVHNPPQVSPATDVRREKLLAARTRARATLASRRVKPLPGKRTRKVGIINGKIHVVVPSRKERESIEKESLMIKDVPMADVNRELISSGLVNYGTSAPDAVKRRMYEDGLSAGGAKAVNTPVAVSNLLSMEQDY